MALRVERQIEAPGGSLPETKKESRLGLFGRVFSSKEASPAAPLAGRAAPVVASRTTKLIARMVKLMLMLKFDGVVDQEFARQVLKLMDASREEIVAMAAGEDAFEKAVGTEALKILVKKKEGRIGLADAYDLIRAKWKAENVVRKSKGEPERKVPEHSAKAKFVHAVFPKEAAEETIELILQKVIADIQTLQGDIPRIIQEFQTRMAGSEEIGRFEWNEQKLADLFKVIWDHYCTGTILDRKTVKGLLIFTAAKREVLKLIRPHLEKVNDPVKLSEWMHSQEEKVLLPGLKAVEFLIDEEIKKAQPKDEEAAPSEAEPSEAEPVQQASRAEPVQSKSEQNSIKAKFIAFLFVILSWIIHKVNERKERALRKETDTPSAQEPVPGEEKVPSDAERVLDGAQVLLRAFERTVSSGAQEGGVDRFVRETRQLAVFMGIQSELQESIDYLKSDQVVPDLIAKIHGALLDPTSPMMAAAFAEGPEGEGIEEIGERIRAKVQTLVPLVAQREAAAALQKRGFSAAMAGRVAALGVPAAVAVAAPVADRVIQEVLSGGSIFATDPRLVSIAVKALTDFASSQMPQAK